MIGACARRMAASPGREWDAFVVHWRTQVFAELQHSFLSWGGLVGGHHLVVRRPGVIGRQEREPIFGDQSVLVVVAREGANGTASACSGFVNPCQTRATIRPPLVTSILRASVMSLKGIYPHRQATTALIDRSWSGCSIWELRKC